MDDLEALRERVETEWYNGNMDEVTKDRILTATPDLAERVTDAVENIARTRMEASVGPKFVPVDLTKFVESGAFLAINERTLWPLGMSLTVDYDKDTGACSNLHVRQWEWEDGHHESIEDAPDDPIVIERHRAFRSFVEERMQTMPANEGERALQLLDPPEGSDL
jgi:hypothetical protein